MDIEIECLCERTYRRSCMPATQISAVRAVCLRAMRLLSRILLLEQID